MCHTQEITYKQIVISSSKHRNEEMKIVDIFDNFPKEHATRSPEM